MPIFAWTLRLSFWYHCHNCWLSVWLNWFDLRVHCLSLLSAGNSEKRTTSTTRLPTLFPTECTGTATTLPMLPPTAEWTRATTRPLMPFPTTEQLPAANDQSFIVHPETTTVSGQLRRCSVNTIGKIRREYMLLNPLNVLYNKRCLSSNIE